MARGIYSYAGIADIPVLSVYGLRASEPGGLIRRDRARTRELFRHTLM